MRKKTELSEEINAVTPNNNIVCFNCKHKGNGIIGYKNRYCRIYTREKGGKSIDILYNGADCPKKETEK